VSIWTGSLSAGLYNYTIVVYDGFSNYIINTQWITVSDITSPVIMSASGNINVQYGSNSELYWVLSDYSPNYYVLYKNGSIINELNWSNLTRVSIWTSNLGLGNYNYTIVVVDQFNNEIISTQWVSITDITPPVVMTSSGNLTVNYGVNSELYWVIADRTPNYFIL